MNSTPCYPQRVHNDLRFCRLTALHVERISAGFRHIVLGGGALDDFTSCGFGDHSKPFFPQPDAHFVPPTVTEKDIVWPEGPRPPSRDYTPLYDELHHELAIDFLIHDGGVAGDWAMQAQPGDKLMVAGLRGSLIVPGGYAYQLYVCDESGMPVLYHRLGALGRPAVKPQVSALINMWDSVCRDYLAHLDGFNIEWLAHDEQTVDTRLAQIQVPVDDYFIWITGESKVVKNLSRRLEAEQHDPQRAHVAVYWHVK